MVSPATLLFLIEILLRPGLKILEASKFWPPTKWAKESSDPAFSAFGYLPKMKNYS
jgi:hypothetical protein